MVTAKDEATVVNVKKINRTGRMIVITIIKKIIIIIITVGGTITEDSVILSSVVENRVKIGIIAATETLTITDIGTFRLFEILGIYEHLDVDVDNI